MGYYYQGVVVTPECDPKIFRTVLARALRALKHHPDIDRWSNILWWCRPMLKEARENMREKEEWKRNSAVFPWVIRCYGNFCLTEMELLAVELARQSILHERATPYPLKRPAFNEVFAMTRGEDRQIFQVSRYLGTENTNWWCDESLALEDDNGKPIHTALW